MPLEDSIKQGLNLIENDKSKVLGLKLGDKTLSTGEYVPRAKVQSPPTLSLSGLSPSNTYLAITLDLDAPFASLPVLGPILHWIQPGFKASSDGTLTTSEAFICNFISPAPPPGAGPHRYVFFLFEQPQGLDVKKYAPANGKPMGNLSRMRTSLDEWKGKLGLGDAVACNYFTSN